MRSAGRRFALAQRSVVRIKEPPIFAYPGAIAAGATESNLKEGPTALLGAPARA
jgi:hypothetical protein